MRLVASVLAFALATAYADTGVMQGPTALAACTFSSFTYDSVQHELTVNCPANPANFIAPNGLVSFEVPASLHLNATGTVTVTRMGSTTGQLDVDYYLGGSSCIDGPGRLIFPDGNANPISLQIQTNGFAGSCTFMLGTPKVNSVINNSIFGGVDSLARSFPVQ